MVDLVAHVLERRRSESRLTRVNPSQGSGQRCYREMLAVHHGIRAKVVVGMGGGQQHSTNGNARLGVQRVGNVQRLASLQHRRVVRSKELSDADVLVLSRTRPEKLGLLYERHAQAVYRYLGRRVGIDAAEDLLGDVFVAAVAARLRVRPHDSGSALPWLYGIAGNVVRSHRRRQLGHSLVKDVTAVDWDAVDERLDAGARVSELRMALAGLTESEREVLLLVAWEGLSPTEAAEVLGLTAVAARSRLHRARTRAQATLGTMTNAGL